MAGSEGSHSIETKRIFAPTSRTFRPRGGTSEVTSWALADKARHYFNSRADNGGGIWGACGQLGWIKGVPQSLNVEVLRLLATTSRTIPYRPGSSEVESWMLAHKARCYHDSRVDGGGIWMRVSPIDASLLAVPEPL